MMRALLPVVLLRPALALADRHVGHGQALYGLDPFWWTSDEL